MKNIGEKYSNGIRFTIGEGLVSPQDIQIQIVHTDNTVDSSQKEYIFSAGYPGATNVTNRLLYFGAALPPPPPELSSKLVDVPTY